MKNALVVSTVKPQNAHATANLNQNVLVATRFAGIPESRLPFVPSVLIVNCAKLSNAISVSERSARPANLPFAHRVLLVKTARVNDALIAWTRSAPLVTIPNAKDAIQPALAQHALMECAPTARLDW